MSGKKKKVRYSCKTVSSNEK